MSEWKKLPDGKEKYHAYLRSEEWKAIRKSIWRRAGGTCERCGMRPMNHVHHLSYQSLYDETSTTSKGIANSVTNMYMDAAIRPIEHERH